MGPPTRPCVNDEVVRQEIAGDVREAERERRELLWQGDTIDACDASRMMGAQPWQPPAGMAREPESIPGS